MTNPNFGHDPRDAHAHLLPGTFATRLPMNAKEHASLDHLLSVHGDDLAGCTRRDVLNTGPLVVELHDGTRWEISETGDVVEIERG